MGVGKRFQYRIKVLSAGRNPALFDMQSCIDLTGEPQDLGPASKILFSTSTSEIVIFKVCFPFYKSLLEGTGKNDHNIFPNFRKRSRLRSLRFLGMASTFREFRDLSWQCLLCHRHEQIMLKAAVLKISSICQESRWTTFSLSSPSYIFVARPDDTTTLR